MKLREEVIKTSIKIYGYLLNLKHPAYHENLAREVGINISDDRCTKNLSDSLNLLEKLNLNKEIGMDGYSLI